MSPLLTALTLDSQWSFYATIKNVLRLAIHTYRILALFTHMKNSSLFADPGQSLPEAPATRVAREEKSGKELAPVQSHRLGCPRSLADLLIQAASLKTDTQES